MIKRIILSAVIISLGMVSAASATVIKGKVTGGSAQWWGGGSFKLVAPTAGYDVGNNNQQSNNLFAFDEDQNIVLTSMLNVNIGSSIAAGTSVSSHYVFFDPRWTRSVKGWVEFDSEVLGIITSRGTLMTSDFLGNGNVNYLNKNLRGLESWSDWARIDSSNNKRIELKFWAKSPGDYIRVITRGSVGGGGGGAGDVPAPASMALLGFALLGFGLMRRKRS